MRKEGWYWVKLPYFNWKTKSFDGGPWMCMQWKGVGWWFDEQGRYIPDSDLAKIGRYIPDPDESEGWKFMPIEPNFEMKKSADIDTPGPMTAWKCWQVMVKHSPEFD